MTGGCHQGISRFYGLILNRIKIKTFWMKHYLVIVLIGFSLLGFMKIGETNRSGPEPWTNSQLIAPADLATKLVHHDTNKPLVYCIGPGALILGSVDMGPAQEKENLEKFKQALEKLPRNADIVIYCGCCPFERCPNIRPAFRLLVEMKFINARLLNLEHNIRTDWVAKGYPSVQ
jgi:thiosulfate/3-mercaptopyruvate sulfurtransferase